MDFLMLNNISALGLIACLLLNFSSSAKAWNDKDNKDNNQRTTSSKMQGELPQTQKITIPTKHLISALGRGQICANGRAYRVSGFADENFLTQNSYKVFIFNGIGTVVISVEGEKYVDLDFVDVGESIKIQTNPPQSESKILSLLNEHNKHHKQR